MTTLQAMHSPHTVQRSWDMSRGAPIIEPPKKVLIRTLSAPQPVEIDTTEKMTVGDLKAEIAMKMSASPRKALDLRWYGSLLEDHFYLGWQEDPNKKLDISSPPPPPHYRIPEGATLELSMHSRSQTEIEQLKQVRQVRVRTMDGKAAVIDGVKPATKIADIKKTIAERKVFGTIPNFDAKNPVCELLYSTVFGASFGTALDDERTIGSYGMLNDDVLVFRPPVDESEGDPKKDAKKK